MWGVRNPQKDPKCCRSKRLLKAPSRPTWDTVGLNGDLGPKKSHVLQSPADSIQGPQPSKSPTALAHGSPCPTHHPSLNPAHQAGASSPALPLPAPGPALQLDHTICRPSRKPALFPSGALPHPPLGDPTARAAPTFAGDLLTPQKHRPQCLEWRPRTRLSIVCVSTPAQQSPGPVGVGWMDVGE